MGNSNGTIEFEYKISVNDYKPLQKIKDPRFGELIQMKNQVTEKVVMMKEKVIKDSDTYRKTIEDYVNHMALKHKNLVRVHGFAGADSQEKNKARIYVYFEYLSDTLQSEINAKKLLAPQKGTKSANKFTEQRLFQITADIVDVLEYLQQNSMSHGDIRPESCFIGKSGAVKLFDRTLVYDATSAFDLVKEGNRGYFLTPKAFECIKKRLNEPMEDKYRADVFGLGLTLLECATLKPSSQIYDWNNYTINLTLLSNRLIEVKERYSANFYNLVKGMLRIEEGQRSDFITLKNQLMDEGWINPYVTTSPNYSDEDVPQLSSQLETKGNTAIQTKSLKDSQLAAIISPNKTSSVQGNKNIFPNNTIQKVSQAQKRYINVKESSFDEPTEDVLPSERIYSVNKVPSATINRSNGSFKSPKNLMSQTGPTSLQEMVLSRDHGNLPRDTAASNRTMEAHPINDKIKNKFSKLQGHFSKPVQQQQAPQNLNISKHFQSAAKSTKNKSIFPGRPDFSKNAPSSAFSEHSVDGDLDTSSATAYQYSYNYESVPVKRDFSVENLLQETLHRSSKLTYFIPESFNQPTQNHSKSDKPHVSGNRLFDHLSQGSFARQNSEINPFTKPKLSINANISHSIEQAPRGNTPNPLPSSKISFKDEECSEVTYFAPDVASGFISPHPRPEDFISNQNSFIEFESVRASHKPVVVDVVDNFDGFNKFFIDSIVKNTESNIENSPYYMPDFEVQTNQVGYEQLPKDKKQDRLTQISSPKVKSHIKPLAKNELHDERDVLDTSLEEDLDQPHVEPFVQSKNISTKEEFAPQEGSSPQFNANLAEEEDLDDRIQKAIERSRQTYLLTTGALNVEKKEDNLYSNASESKFSDILDSKNAINYDQVVVSCEMGENKFSQLSEIQG